MEKLITTLRESALWFATRAKTGEWIQAGIYFAVGIIIILLADRILRMLMDRLMRNFSDELRKHIFIAARGPVRLLIFVYFSLLAFDAFKSMPSALWSRVHNDFVPIINGFTLLVLAYRLVDITTELLRARWTNGTTELDVRWADLFGKVGKGIVIVIGLLCVLSNFMNIMPYLTGLSFLGAAIALASQKTIANAIGSLEIMMDRLFKEGDRISFGEYDGFVTRMGLRSIELTALTGEKIKLPNKDLVDQQIRNYSKDKLVRTTLTVGITYDCDRAKIEKAITLMDETIKAHPRIDRVTTVFKRMSDFSLDLEAIFWADYRTALEYNLLINELHLAIKEKFDSAGIAFAFPTQTLYVKREA